MKIDIPANKHFKGPGELQPMYGIPNVAFRRNARDLEEARRDLVFRPPRIQLDHTISARSGLNRCVPRSEGVYLFHDLRGVLYIGRSGNLQRRFVQHLDEGQNSWLNKALYFPVGEVRFSWILVAPGESELLERGLVGTFRPLCNRTTRSNPRSPCHEADIGSQIHTASSTIGDPKEAKAKL